MKNINYKDYVWLSSADKETFISIYNKDEDFKAISFIANNNEYELKKNDLKLFSQNLISKEKFNDKIEALNNEYSVLVKDGFISFVSLDYSIPSKTIYSEFISDFGRYDLIIEAVEEDYIEFVIKNTKFETSGIACIFEDSLCVLTDEDDDIKNRRHIDDIAKKIIRILFSECITQ